MGGRVSPLDLRPRDETMRATSKLLSPTKFNSSILRANSPFASSQLLTEFKDRRSLHSVTMPLSLNEFLPPFATQAPSDDHRGTISLMVLTQPVGSLGTARSWPYQCCHVSTDNSLPLLPMAPQLAGCCKGSRPYGLKSTLTSRPSLDQLSIAGVGSCCSGRKPDSTIPVLVHKN